jgi:hypothetical protein
MDDYKAAGSGGRTLTAERAYERMFLEMLLRHELPEDCTIRIHVTPTVVADSATAEFALNGNRIDVESDIGLLSLPNGVISPSPPNW